MARTELGLICGLLWATASTPGLSATCLNAQNTAVPISTPTAAFTVGSDGTVHDPKTGLTWMRCLVGQSLVDQRCTGTPTALTWAEAVATAATRSFAGASDWRMANPKELASILEDRCAGPALNADLFPIPVFNTWTSTPSAVGLTTLFDQAWAMDSNGGLRPLAANQGIPVLLVRSPR